MAHSGMGFQSHQNARAFRMLNGKQASVSIVQESYGYK